MRKPEDVPQDVWAAAIRTAETVCRNLPDDYGDLTVEITAIARAILAERERCAKIAEIEQHRKGLLVMERDTAARIAAAIRKGGE